jgi:hypothetical protein
MINQMLSVLMLSLLGDDTVVWQVFTNLLESSTLRVEAEYFSKMLVITYQTTAS